MLEKEDFLRNIEAIKKEDAQKRKLEEALEEFNSSFTVLNTGPCENRLLELTKQEMEDADDYIEWYLYEDVKKVVSTKMGNYELKTDEDLYYFLTAVCHPEDDSAYYIAEHIKSLNESDLEGMSLYMYVCNNYNSLIDRMKDDDDRQNLVTELRFLKSAIENEK